MKIKKSILSMLFAVLLIITPQFSCLAAEDDTPADTVYSDRSTANAVELTAEGFAVDNANITPGSTFNFTFKLKNPSTALDVKNVSIRLSGGEALSISNDVDTIYKDTIAKNSTAQFSKRFFCSTSAETGMYPITVSAVYTYTADGETEQGSTEFSYTVKVTKTQTSTSQSASGTPSFTASFSVNKSKIYPEDTFKLALKLKNMSASQRVTNVNIRFAGGDAFSISKDVDSAYSSGIAAGTTAAFSKVFVCNKGVEAGMHPVTVSVAYEYVSGGEKQQATAEFTYSIQTYTKKQTSATAKVSLTPQLLISGFSYGSDEINGGDIFDLKFDVKNNSDDIAIQNIIIKLSGGESFVVADGTDTLTLKSLGAGASQSLSKSFKCLSSAPSGVYPVAASVSYEYIEGGSKQAGSSELTMSVPVVQQDKVQFNSIDLADKTVTVGEESDCAFSLVNTGQTKLSNGTVKLVDSEGRELASAFIGNIEAGAQFTSNYTLPVTFEKTGTEKLKLIFEYENENAEKKSLEQEFNVTVEEYFDPYENLTEDDPYDAEDAESGFSVNSLIGVCVAAVVVILVLILVIRKFVKRKKSKKGSESFDEEI